MSERDVHEQLDRIERRQHETMQLLLSVLRQLGINTRLEITTMAKLDDVTAHLQGLEDAAQGVTTLLDTISAELKDAREDPAKIDALIAKIDADKASLADAIVRNTPADPNGGGSQPTG